jgi:hypothetical protein
LALMPEIEIDSLLWSRPKSRAVVCNRKGAVMRTWFRNLRPTFGQRWSIWQRSVGLRVEHLEHRTLLSNGVVQTALVSAIPGLAPHTDRSGAASQEFQRVPARTLVRNATEIKRNTCLHPAGPTLAQILGHLVQEVLGITLILLGSGLILTLVLMPIGLPLALVGMALIAAPSD